MQFAVLGVQINIISGDDPQTVAVLTKQVGVSSTIQTMGGSVIERLGAS